MTEKSFLRRADHKWHVAINKHVNEVGYLEARWMYDAKHLAGESKRLTIWFERERLGTLPKLHRQCSHSGVEAIEDNHLFCCLGVKCHECPHLKAIADSEMEEADKDHAKAWTCCAHIVSQGGDRANEGFVMHVGDRMFWDNMYQSLANPPEPDK